MLIVEAIAAKASRHGFQTAAGPALEHLGPMRVHGFELTCVSFAIRSGNNVEHLPLSRGS